MDFKTKATKSVLPRILFVVDYCYRNERNLGFMSLSGKDEKSPNACQHRHLPDTERKHSEMILTGSGKQPTGFRRVFLQLLILACNRDVHQEECWKRVSQLLANILTVL